MIGGDDYCEILPPLSWFAFDWPTRAQHEKTLGTCIPWKSSCQKENGYSIIKVVAFIGSACFFR